MRLFHCTLRGDDVAAVEFSTEHHVEVVRAFVKGETGELSPGIFFTKHFRSSNKVTWIATAGAGPQEVEKAVLNAKEIVFK